jgi:DNA-binding phage protein
MTDMFWDDLARDMEDPEFAREYITESVRIAAVDAAINDLDAARASAGLTKADLARMTGKHPAAIRRLFSASGTNPTLGTVAEVAAVLGLRMSFIPMDPDELEAVTAALRSGSTDPASARVSTQLRPTPKQKALPA